MSVRRIMGSETEYGISVPAAPSMNAMQASSLVVNSYAQRTVGRLAARAGTSRKRTRCATRAVSRPQSPPLVDPSAPANEDDLGLANVILTNGARFYVDHAHPEYSTPEVTTPRDVVLWDKAGERIIAEAARRALSVPGTLAGEPLQEQHRQQGRLVRLPRELPDVAQHVLRRHRSATSRRSSSAARWSAAPAGSASARTAQSDGFQLSQRADFFEVEVGLETTLKRPIINTRDEPHADPEKYRRLHVIIGDANLSEISTYLKVGTTSLVLAMIEEGWLGGRPLPRSPGRHAAGGQPRPVAEQAGHPARRPQDDRRAAADGVPRAGPQVRRGPAGAATPTSRPATCWPAGSRRWCASRPTR